VLLNCDGMQGFASGKEERLLIAGLAQQASRERPLPCCSFVSFVSAGRSACISRLMEPGGGAPRSAMLQLTVVQDGVKKSETAVPLDVGEFPLEQEVPLSTTFAPGFYTVTAQLEYDGAPCGVYRTGFWVRDEAYLASGPRVSVDADFFEIDGKSTPIMGTTYMASDAQRLFLRYPNPYVWDQDMQQISAAGMNMLRTGLWTDWDVASGGTGVANEHTLRTIEAFLMTARRYRLPVQFNLFAFMPEVFGGVNPYLDPEAVRRESGFAGSIAHRFSGCSVPDVGSDQRAELRQSAALFQYEGEWRSCGTEGLERVAFGALRQSGERGCAMEHSVAAGAASRSGRRGLPREKQRTRRKNSIGV